MVQLAPEAFRSVFKTIDKDILRWFPGHMSTGLKKMQQKLSQVDCIIEVHDARIPLSGRNSDFKYTISGVKPQILVLNKADLIDIKYRKQIERKLKSNNQSAVIFTNAKDFTCKGIKRLFPLAQDLIASSDRYNRANAEDYSIMIVGVPNVGKSSLINALRTKYLGKGRATAVGAVPGITRSVLTKIKMCENPLFYMFDTPGILTPNIDNVETGLKLAVCNTIQDHLVGEDIISDYLLFWLNKHKHFEYVKYFGLNSASDNILEVLAHISIKNKKMLKILNCDNEYVLKPDLKTAAQIMLRAFREGYLGKICLDEEFL